MDSSKAIGFAVVGCGSIGQRRAAAVPPGSLLYACDLDHSRAERVAKQYPGCTATDNFEQLLQDNKVSAVIISTVNSSLAPITLAAVKAGKHVLVEKPAAIRSADLEEIERAASLTGSRVRIGYNHRYHPSFLKARELIVQEQLGEPFMIRGRYGHGGRPGYDREWRADPKLSGGGELIDQGVHLIDLAGSFLGEWVQVDGHTATYYWEMPVDDNAFLSLRTANGHTAWLHVSCSEWKNLFCFEIYFRRAKLQIDGLGRSYGTESLSYFRMLPEMGPPETTIFEFPRGDQSWAYEVNEFVSDIEQQRLPKPGIAEGRSTLRVVEAIYSNCGFDFIEPRSNRPTE
jgi:predicted dehydrogenase